MPDDGEPPCGTGEGMFDGEVGTAGTFGWQMGGCPVVPLTECIPEPAFVKGKPMCVYG